MKKLIRIALLLIALFLNSITALAAPIASPTSYSISAVTVYSPALETNDQIWVISYSITYGTNPDENAGQAWLIRLLLDGATEITSTSPYAFYNDGYSSGVASFYLPASEAPVWSGNYTVSLEPNPTLTWTSLPSQAIFSAITWSTAATFDDVATALGNQVRALAVGLNSAWSATTNPIIESVNGLLKLTDRGASYFDVVIPQLRAIQPDLYQSAIIAPYLSNPDYGDTYQQQVDNQTSGTPLDVTNTATNFGLSRLWANGALWGFFCIAIAGTVGYKAQSAKPVFFLMGALMIPGGWMGFGLLQSVLFVLLGIASIILAFAWRGA